MEINKVCLIELLFSTTSSYYLSYKGDINIPYLSLKIEKKNAQTSGFSHKHLRSKSLWSQKHIKGFKDKKATAQLAAQLEKEAELAQAGIVDKYKEYRKRPLKEHLEDFLSSLQAKGNTPDYCNLTHYRVERICSGCKFIYWDDISASEVQLYIADLRDSGEVSQKTSNYYLQVLKQFCNWMLKDKRAGGESPLKHLDAIKVTDKVNQRALTPDELRSLLQAT